MKAVLLLALLLVTSSSICAVQVFYVGSTTECSSADNSPCHSLQYYANNSNFTSNSIFHFLQGQHHLETVITIRNVVNLTLVGASSGVKIRCHSPQSGFSVKEFRYLVIENMTFSECSLEYYASRSAVVLDTGSELSLKHITISKSSSDSEYTGLSVNNVTGSFSIRSSVFHMPMGNGIAVFYPLSNTPGMFEFISNDVSSCNRVDTYGLSLHINTPNVQMVLTGSNFKLANEGSIVKEYSKVKSLQANFTVATNDPIKISNSSFVGKALINFGDFQCSPNHTIAELSGVLGNIVEIYSPKFPRECLVFIEDSNLTFLIATLYKNLNDESVSQVRLHNTTIINGTGIMIQFWDILIVNCTFSDNKKTAIASFGSLVIFQGYNIFQNNSAPVWRSTTASLHRIKCAPATTHYPPVCGQPC